MYRQQAGRHSKKREGCGKDLENLISEQKFQGAINLLIDVYKKEFVNMGGYLTNPCQVNLERRGTLYKPLVLMRMLSLGSVSRFVCDVIISCHPSFSRCGVLLAPIFWGWQVLTFVLNFCYNVWSPLSDVFSFCLS